MKIVKNNENVDNNFENKNVIRMLMKIKRKWNVITILIKQTEQNEIELECWWTFWKQWNVIRMLMNMLKKMKCN